MSRSIQRVKMRLKRSIGEKATQRTERALYAIASMGLAESDMRTPVDTSMLINSRFGPDVRGHLARVGYLARYAAAVHSAPGKLKGQPRARLSGGTQAGKYWDPAGEPRFLEKGFDAIRPKVPAILKAIYAV